MMDKQENTEKATDKDIDKKSLSIADEMDDDDNAAKPEETVAVQDKLKKMKI